MFEKLKKFWSSNSNLNGNRKSSPKFVRTKSGRSLTNLNLRQSARQTCSNGEERIKPLITSKPPSTSSAAPDVSLSPINPYPPEDSNESPRQGYIARRQLPSTENDVTLVPSSQSNTIQSNECEYPNNSCYIGLIEKNSQSVRSADNWLGLQNDEIRRNCRDLGRPSLNMNTSATLQYCSPLSLKNRRARSFVHLSGYSRPSSNTIGHTTGQSYDNQSGTYRERVMRPQEPSLSSSGFISNTSTPTYQERYINGDELTSYKEMGNRLAKSSNCIDPFSSPKNSRISVESSYIPIHFTSPMRSTTNINLSNHSTPRYAQEDVFFDKSSRNTLSTAVSCQRIDELEESLRDIQRKMSTSTSVQMQSIVQTENTHQALLSILMDKKKEADRLKDKLKKMEYKLQKQQCDFADETDKVQLEVENIRHKLKLMTEKFNKLDQEYRLYRNFTLASETDNQKNFDTINEIKEGYEREIDSLKQKLSDVLVVKGENSSCDDDSKKWLEEENLTLAAKLIEREEEIAKLKTELGINCSFKASVNDEEYDDENLLVLDEYKDSNNTPLRRNKKERVGRDTKYSSHPLYSSANQLSPIYSPSNSSGFGGSQSHKFFSSPVVEMPHHPRIATSTTRLFSNNSNEVSCSSGNAQIAIQPRIQRIIKDSNEIGRRLRMISKCFSEISTNIIDGKDPEFYKLASRFDDSSDSEEDFNNFDSKISYNSLLFEDILRKHQEDIQRAEKFLSQVSSNVIHYTTREPGENKNTCTIQ